MQSDLLFIFRIAFHYQTVVLAMVLDLFVLNAIELIEILNIAIHVDLDRISLQTKFTDETFPFQVDHFATFTAVLLVDPIANPALQTEQMHIFHAAFTFARTYHLVIFSDRAA